MFGQNNSHDDNQQKQDDQFNMEPPMPPAPTLDDTSAPADQAFSGFPSSAPAAPTVDPAADAAEEPVEEVTAATPSLPESGTVTVENLLSIKQEALQHLSPLVNHLELAPEEKFRTTMMLIQAADDKNLLQTAYDLAKQITDEKVRAQALLDVVNEINYFTQQPKTS